MCEAMLPCRASPEIAAYPFTTLMPNLGVLASDKQEPKARDQYGDLDFLLHDGSTSSSMSSASGPVLADMPGLIQGAHAGRGLGRMFLRHLRRTQGLLHVVDASAGVLQHLTMRCLCSTLCPDEPLARLPVLPSVHMSVAFSPWLSC